MCTRSYRNNFYSFPSFTVPVRSGRTNDTSSEIKRTRGRALVRTLTGHCLQNQGSLREPSSSAVTATDTMAVFSAVDSLLGHIGPVCDFCFNSITNYKNRLNFGHHTTYQVTKLTPQIYSSKSVAQ